MPVAAGRRCIYRAARPAAFPLPTRCCPIPAVLQEQAQLQAAAVSASAAGHKVAVLGAAGGIGQPLSLLLKL